MTYDEEPQIQIKDLPEPCHELRLKAWRKAVLGCAEDARRHSDALVNYMASAMIDLPPGPDRDDILRDWRAGFEAYNILADMILRDLMDKAPPEGK